MNVRKQALFLNIKEKRNNYEKRNHQLLILTIVGVSVYLITGLFFNQLADVVLLSLLFIPIAYLVIRFDRIKHEREYAKNTKKKEVVYYYTNDEISIINEVQNKTNQKVNKMFGKDSRITFLNGYIERIIFGDPFTINVDGKLYNVIHEDKVVVDIIGNHKSYKEITRKQKNKLAKEQEAKELAISVNHKPSVNAPNKTAIKQGKLEVKTDPIVEMNDFYSIKDNRLNLYGLLSQGYKQMGEIESPVVFAPTEILPPQSTWKLVADDLLSKKDITSYEITDGGINLYI